MTGQKLADMALAILPKKWGYIYGTAGVLWTQAKQNELDKTTDKNRESGRKYGKKWIGHYVADCSGFVKYLCKQLGFTAPHGSNSIWDSSVYEKGTITGPIPTGALVFKCRNGDDFYHIGVYVGNNRVVEAQGTQTGVVETALSTWTHYGLLKNLGYSYPSRDEEPVPDKDEEKPIPVHDLHPGVAVVDVPNDGTVNIRKQPEVNSTKLGTLREGESCHVLSIDGSWAEVEYAAHGYIMTKYLRNEEG